MKILKILSVSALLLLFANNSKAQATASATAEGTIVAPIAIAKNLDLDFGNVAVSASPGTVVMALNGSRTVTGGCTLPSTSGSVSFARFDVTGQPNYTYSITLPSSAHTITHTNNTDVMTVSAFTDDLSGTGDLGTGGAEQFRVAGTLNVAGSQLAGVYTSATGFDVTVNYN